MLGNLVNCGTLPACLCNGGIPITDKRYFKHFYHVILQNERNKDKTSLIVGESDTLELWLELTTGKNIVSAFVPLHCLKCDTVFRTTRLRDFVHLNVKGCKCPLAKTQRALFEELQKMFGVDNVDWEVPWGQMRFDIGI